MVNDVQIFGSLDVAEAAFYLFVAFFVGLILYLRREDRREGYPLEEDTSGRLEPTPGFFWFATPKTFKLPHGHGTVTAPNMVRDTRTLAARRTAPWPGAPIEPTGDPLVDGIGPAAYAERANVPDIMHDGTPKIVPIGKADGFSVAREDESPVGYAVIGCDGNVAGTVADLWIDRMEQMIRYLEVDVTVDGGSKRRLVPMTMAAVDGGRRRVRIHAVRADQFANAPTLAAADRITLLEEEKVCGYFGGGYLYALPGRSEALL